MKYHFLIIGLLIISINSKKEIDATEIEARISYDNTGTWKIVTDNFEEINYVATGYYNSVYEQKGFDIIAITTNKIFSDDLQAEAAGRLEGFLSRDRINYHYKNLISISGKLSNEERNFFQGQLDFIKSEYLKNPDDPHIYNAHLIYLQFKGMVEEYNARTEIAEDKIDEIDFNIMTAFGDMIEIRDKFKPHDFSKMTTDELKLHFLLNSHCSAIFKAKEDITNVFMAHNSWYYYSMMNRMIKEYNFNFNHPSVKAKTVIFSSYPATLSSNDDFYVTSQDLSVIETTNIFYNSTFYELMVPETLLTWQRVIIANRMSQSAEEWSTHFSPYNSGTYNNMYMVLDMKLVDLENQKIEDKAMFTIEQIPKLVKANDVTNHLRYGYWPSYNTTYDKEIIALSLIQEQIKKTPELIHEIDYDMCSRSTIMRRDQSKIVDIESLKKFIRYNNYKNDELTGNNPVGSLSARGDLLPKPQCFGAYDAKASSVKDLKGKNKKIYVVAGPTYEDELEPFVWSKQDSCFKYGKNGLSDEAKYEWFEYENRFKD